MDWVTTSTVLDRLRRNDDRSMWDRFMTRFQRPIRALAMKLGLSSAEAEDVVQETLVAFLEGFRAGKYRREVGRLSSWLFGIAYRQAANARRRRAGAKEKPVAGDNRTAFWDHVPEESDVSQAWDLEWERAMLESCLECAKAEVAPTTYRAFEMIVREGRSPDDAARETGLSRDAVYVAKHRMLKRLAELTKEFEETEPS
jgi:RNA polymerase sigma factor (sigma-70 family)